MENEPSGAVTVDLVKAELAALISTCAPAMGRCCGSWTTPRTWPKMPAWAAVALRRRDRMQMKGTHGTPRQNADDDNVTKEGHNALPLCGSEYCGSGCRRGQFRRGCLREGRGCGGSVRGKCDAGFLRALALIGW